MECTRSSVSNSHHKSYIYCVEPHSVPTPVMNPGFTKRRRTQRYICPFCKYSLQHTAYRRHQDLPHIFCPAHNDENVSSSGSDSTFEFSEPAECMNPTLCSNVSHTDPVTEDELSFPPENSSSSSDEIDGESATEVWDDDESDSSTSEFEENIQSTQSQLNFLVSVFLSFFQLCFQISDRAIVHLLAFISALLHFLSSRTKDSGLLKQFSDGFPKTLYSIRKALNLSSSYTKFVVCPRCHRLYNESECVMKLPSGDRGLKCDYVRFPNHPQYAHRRKCGAELMKKVKLGQNIIESLQRMIKMPGFLDSCEEWRTRNVPENWFADVYDGKLWKEWMMHDGVSFLEVPGNLILMLNIDWFQPFDHTQYSIGVIFLVIQNLPRSMRFRPENIIIVSTIPGPKEPSCGDLNPYLSCLVNDLLKLWEGVQMQTPSSILSMRLIRAALVYISCDLPATRKVCGFYGIKAMHGCSKCLKCFPTTDLKTNYSGFDRTKWQPRSRSTHLAQAKRANDATTRSSREAIEQELGIRYSELLKLPYFDVVRYHLVDPMHNLFLGTAKKLVILWKERNYITKAKFEEIQNEIDDIVPPGNVGRIPHKIASECSGFTAEQWMLWTVLYSPLVLYNKLPQEYYDHWCLFSQACSLLCCPNLHLNEVDKADELLLAFCVKYQELYGEDSCTPNMHMHCHLKDCIKDVGPLHAFWCFSFERYNGILGRMQKSWQSPEIQLVHKFSKLQMLSSVELPQEIPSELRHCFMQIRQAKTALPAPILDSLIVMKYEQNMLCLPTDICSTTLPCHQLLPPGREKYMTEEVRDMLSEMYAVIYGVENLIHVPLRYVEFHDIKVFQTTYISEKSRSRRSPAVLAVWPSPSGIITSRTPCGDDVRVGEVKYFLLHCVKVKTQATTDPEVAEKAQIIACIKWYEDHPHKFLLGNGIVISASTCTGLSSASFMPVSRILTQCAIVHRNMHLDYGEDSVQIALPIKQHSILRNV